jgi:large subunit ribosomal protein L31
MKKKIHPKWYPDCKVTCACGNTFTVGATVPELTVEVCSACHPFYTGQMKFVDTTGRVEAFKTKQKGAAKKNLSKSAKRKMKREKKLQEEMNRPETLEEVRKQVKKAK